MGIEAKKDRENEAGGRIVRSKEAFNISWRGSGEKAVLD